MRQRQTLGTLGLLPVLCGSLALSLVAVSGKAAALTDDDQDYHRRALQAFTEARYEQALQLFSLGYADTKQPELLIRIGQTYLKLGRNAEALQACESYISRVENPDLLYKGYAEQCIAEAKRPAAARPAARGAAPPPAETPRPAETAARPAETPRPVEPTARPSETSSRPTEAAARPAEPAPVRAAGEPLGSAASAAPPLPPAPVVPPLTTTTVPPPVNLNAAYDRCLKYQQEGRTDSARSCYLDFLPGALRLGGIPDGDVGPLMTQLQRFPEPSSAFPPVLRQHEDRRNTGLWAAGLTLWLSAWVPAVVYAPLYPNRDSDDSHKTIYYTLAIPIVGPFISGIWLPLTYSPGSARNDVVLNYTVPWIVADGLAQLVGFTMFLGGVQTRRLPVPPAVERVLSTIRIAPYNSSDGGGIVASGRF
jgi:hypothetical protein